MKIGIDLNDVYRGYTAQFASFYKKVIDHAFDIDDVEIWTNDLEQVFPFDSHKAYLDFLYHECAFEVFGSASPMSKSLPGEINSWLQEIENLDEIPEVCFLSTKEFNRSIGASLFFISKYAINVRECHMLLKENDVWEKCDVLITANPNILKNVPDSKKVIKIKTTYNTECESEFEYETLSQFMNDEDILEKLNK
jgi:hypothetical protein